MTARGMDFIKGMSSRNRNLFSVGQIFTLAFKAEESIFSIQKNMLPVFSLNHMGEDKYPKLLNIHCGETYLFVAET